MPDACWSLRNISSPATVNETTMSPADPTFLLRLEEIECRIPMGARHNPVPSPFDEHFHAEGPTVIVAQSVYVCGGTQYLRKELCGFSLPSWLLMC
jgi:hypothetical protein